MPDLCFIFEVHQPFRLNRNFNIDLLTRQKVEKEDLFQLYFDSKRDREIFNRIAGGCYLPANQIILESIDQSKRDKKRSFKVAYSLSGTFIEQCERWNRDLLESFRQLARTGCVELLDQTYFHSLASLFNAGSAEFVEQIKAHREVMKSLFNCEPSVFENSECLYNNEIAKTADRLNYEAIITEGFERVLGWRSPNYVYRARDSRIRVLFRNYRLSDDIGFRFNARDWVGWPLTADKYAGWLASTPGQVINVFIDYETFGEHHRRESGIFEFLKWLPVEAAKWDNLSFCTPSEAVKRHSPVDEIDIPEHETISWADIERDTSAWLGNPLQRISLNLLKGLEPVAKDIGDELLLKIWRYLQTSDHLYYMSTKSGGPGDVHSSFNPYGNPFEAFITYIDVLSDLQARFHLELERPRFRHKRILRHLSVEKGFIFFHSFARPTGLIAYGLSDFHSIIRIIGVDSITFHMSRGDFERWLDQVVDDGELAKKIAKLPKDEADGEDLRRKILALVEERIEELEKLDSKTS